jgi:hypothetical protein
MTTVTVSKSEYDILKAQASAYRQLVKVAVLENEITPPTRSKSKVLEAFKKTGKYNKEFLISLKKGLSRSSFFTQK